MEKENDNKKKPDKVDFYLYDEAMARAERHTHRWMVAFFAAFVALVISNAIWIWYESQYEDVVTATQTVTQDTGNGSGANNFNGDFYGGDYNGKADSEENVQ